MGMGTGQAHQYSPVPPTAQAQPTRSLPWPLGWPRDTPAYFSPMLRGEGRSGPSVPYQPINLTVMFVTSSLD